MNQSQLMTIGALGFAAFAVLMLKKQTGSPVAAISPQPAQQKRDAGLTSFMESWQKATQDMTGGQASYRPISF